MDLFDLLYENFIGNLWFHRVLFIVLIVSYFYTDIYTRFFVHPCQAESPFEDTQEEKDFKELDLGSIRCCEAKGEPDESEAYTSDFISESESDSETVKAEKSLIKKHFKILNEIQDTKFKIKSYDCSYHYSCTNDTVKFECCFCKICGNYICYRNNPSPKIMCTHYKLIDSVDSRIQIFSGHIRTDDEDDVRKTIESFFETNDELEMNFYKSRLLQLVYDDESESNSESLSD
jgi:hypothetical protein